MAEGNFQTGAALLLRNLMTSLANFGIFRQISKISIVSNYVLNCQDGARIHTSNASLDFLQGVFGDRIMTGRRRGQMMDWPASSPDLSAADFWLHGYLKVSSIEQF